MMPPPGAVVLWWDGQKPTFGAVDCEEKQRLRVIDPAGREQRVKASKLAAIVGRPAGLPAREPDRRPALADCARATESRVREEAGEIDAALLWELAADESLSIEGLADLALGRTDGAAVAATIVALIDDGIRFSRKGANWLARMPEAVAGLLRQREVVQRRETETARLFAALRELGEESRYDATGDETEQTYLQALRELAVRREDVGETSRRRAHEALEAWGQPFVRDFEGAFRLVRRLGGFDSDDENLQIERFGLPGDFTPEQLAAADRCARLPQLGAERRDLSELPTLTVDGASTRELDDALSWEALDDGESRLGIHIADPSAFVAPEDLLDLAARERGTTHYFPDSKITMLPPQIAEGCASLVQGELRPALSFLVDLGNDGTVRRKQVFRSTIRSDRRMTYEEFDERLAEPAGDLLDAPIAGIAAVGQARLTLRRAAGAVHLAGPEAEIFVGADGPRVEVRQRDAPSQIAVSEAMVLVGEIAAEILAEAGAPAIFRGQGEPAAMRGAAAGTPDPSSETEETQGASVVPSDETLLLELHRMRRRLRRAESALRPRPHHSLALPAYVQATSPLRRYQDWVNQRQLIALLEGGEPVFDREALQQILATTDGAERRARRAEREANDYWLLRWLEQRTGETMPALVLETEPKPWVLLMPCLWERSPARLPDCEPGETLQILVARVCPRAGLVQLQPV